MNSGIGENMNNSRSHLLPKEMILAGKHQDHFYRDSSMLFGLNNRYNFLDCITCEQLKEINAVVERVTPRYSTAGGG